MKHGLGRPVAVRIANGRVHRVHPMHTHTARTRHAHPMHTETMYTAYTG